MWKLPRSSSARSRSSRTSVDWCRPFGFVGFTLHFSPFPQNKAILHETPENKVFQSGCDF